MKRLNQLGRRGLFFIVALIFSLSMSLSNLLFVGAASAAQVNSRSITMSTSYPGANATYSLAFTPVSSAQELVVDFCSNSPLVGDTCSFSSSTVPTIAAPTSSLGTASAVGTGSPVHTIEVTGLTMTGGTPFTVNFTSGITNPTTATSFYARIVTFATGGAAGYVPANTTGATPTSGSFVDYGGDALSTANSINITAKVFETLTFCVFQTSCGTAPSLTLGDPITGALSSSNAYVNSNAQYTVATNAGSGVNIVMKGTTLCNTTGAACQSGTASVNTITPMSNVPAALTTGTEQFGMCADSNGSTALTVAAAYTDSVNNCHAITTGLYTGTSKFGFDNANVVSTSGSTVLSSTGAVPSITGSFAFLADISVVTEAGLYTTTLNMVATSTY